MPGKLGKQKIDDGTTCFVLGLTGSCKSTINSYMMGASIKSKKIGLNHVLELEDPSDCTQRSGTPTFPTLKSPNSFRPKGLPSMILQDSLTLKEQNRKS